jgi:hypothetical protein
MYLSTIYLHHDQKWNKGYDDKSVRVSLAQCTERHLNSCQHQHKSPEISWGLYYLNVNDFLCKFNTIVHIYLS